MISAACLWVHSVFEERRRGLVYSGLDVANIAVLRLAVFGFTVNREFCYPNLSPTQDQLALVGGPCFGSRVTSSVLHGVLVSSLLFSFLAHMVGGGLYILVCRNLQRRLFLHELAFVNLQTQRIFARMPVSAAMASRFSTYPWRFGGTALYLAVAINDPQLLVSWLQDRLRTMTLFQHRRFFSTLAVTLQTAVLAPSYRYRLLGLSLAILGKISVTGNAMSRTYSVSYGVQGNSALSIRTSQAFTIVRTRTGCLGLTLGFYF